MSELRTKATVAEGVMFQGGGVVDYQPGNGTRYVVVSMPIEDPGAARVLGAPCPSVLFTFPLWGKTIILTPGDPVFAWWIGDKLHLGESDATVVTELLAHLLGSEAT
jgi:hypothetical protein